MNKNILTSNRKFSRQKIKQLLNDNKVKEKLVKIFTEITLNKNKKKKNIDKNELISHFKIDKDKIRKIKKIINLFKFRFSYVKKCLVYSFFYQGKENKKLQVLHIVDNEPEELFVNANKLLENNKNALEQKNTRDDNNNQNKVLDGEDVKNDEKVLEQKNCEKEDKNDQNLINLKNNSKNELEEKNIQNNLLDVKKESLRISINLCKNSIHKIYLIQKLNKLMI